MIFSSSGSASRAGLAVGAALLAALASGCGAGKGSSPHSGHAAPKPITAVKAIDLAATQHISSLSATISINEGGGTVGQVNATMNAQFRPTTFIEMTLKSFSFGGSAPGNIEEILTSKALYLKDGALSRVVKKPWVMMTFAQLSSKAGVNFGSLVQSLENSNPENQVKLFAISKNIHVVGSQTINGVATTEYAGSYLPSAAVSKLPASLRKLMGPALRLMGSTPVTFRVWIDAQHLARKAIVNETFSGHSIVTTYTITSVNQPVNTTLPAPAQVASVP
jgi:hypothetical protein